MEENINGLKKFAKAIGKVLITALMHWKLVIIVVIIVFIVTFIADILQGLLGKNESDINTKRVAIETAYVPEKVKEANIPKANAGKPNSETTAVPNPNTSTSANTTVIITLNDDNTGYKFSYDDTSENMNKIKEKLSKEIKDFSAEEFEEFELAILGSFVQRGSDLESFSKEELKCLPQFFRVEAATQNLDLRPNSQKLDANGEYVPMKLDDFSDSNQVPGIVLIQKNNRKTNTTVTLEYMDQETFNNWCSQNTEAAMKEIENKFTINDKGEVVYAYRQSEKVEILEGEFPEELPEEEKTKEKLEYKIETDTIDYRECIKKYKMPFEFLVQLLITTYDPNFCMNLGNYALGGKIIINIQEEDVKTVQVEDKTYTIYNRVIKELQYRDLGMPNSNIQPATPFKTEIINGTTVKDKNENPCTTHTETTKNVKIQTTNEYSICKWDIAEVDSWWLNITKEYAQPKLDSTTGDNTIEDKDNEYVDKEPTIINDKQKIKDDTEAGAFIQELEKKPTIEPVVIINGPYNSNGIYYNVIVQYEFQGQIKKIYEKACYKLDEKYEDGDSKFDFDNEIKVTVPETFQQLTYEFKRTAKTIPYPPYIDATYSYELKDIIKLDLIEPIKLSINEGSRIDFTNKITTTTERYAADSNPKSNSKVYATESGNPGGGETDKDTVYLKFLDAYNKSPGARNNLEGIDSWLYEMMEKRESTVELIDVVKYLLYMYDGKDRGVTELDLSLYEPDEFTSVNITSGTGWWWPIASTEIEQRNGKKFSVGENPSCQYISSGFGNRGDPFTGEAEFHPAIDIAGNGDLYIIAVASGTVIRAGDSNDGYGYTVSIKHSNGMITRYSHMRAGSITVQVGETVEQGQVIGMMGSTGYSTGQHLDFGILDANGNALNPLDYVNSEKGKAYPKGIGGISSELYNFIATYEGGTQYFDGTYYTVFNNGADGNLEVTCGVAIGSIEGGAYDYVNKLVEKNVVLGDKITIEQYNEIFKRTVEAKAQTVDSAIAVTGVVLTQQQKDAVYSFCWNAAYAYDNTKGALTKYKNSGDKGYWEYIHNFTSRYEAIAKRRAEEFEMFREGDYTPDTSDNALTKHRNYNIEFGLPEYER